MFPVLHQTFFKPTASMINVIIVVDVANYIYIYIYIYIYVCVCVCVSARACVYTGIEMSR